jgi:hypothetical protein
MIRTTLIAFALLTLASLTPGAFLAQAPKGDATILHGRITDEAGHPISGVRVQLYNGIATRWQGQSTTSDEDGRYRFDPLQTGGGRQGVLAPGMQIFDARYASADGKTWWDVEVPIGHDAEHNFTLIRGGTIHGTLTFGAGDWTLRDFDVRIMSTDKKRTAYAKTGPRGEFTTDALLPGEYTVQANDSRMDYPEIARMTVEPGKVASFKARCLFSMKVERLE